MKKLRALPLLLLLFSFRTSDTPVVNQKVIEYVNSVIGKKVDRGECWDLANAALNYAGARWQPPFRFGKPVDYKKEPVLPGDIIHITNVTMESRTETSVTRWKMSDHTAILYDAGSDGRIRVAEQNVNNVRKVMISDWNLADVKSGKLEFFRPQAQ